MVDFAAQIKEPSKWLRGKVGEKPGAKTADESGQQVLQKADIGIQRLHDQHGDDADGRDDYVQSTLNAIRP